MHPDEEDANSNAVELWLQLHQRLLKGREDAQRLPLPWRWPIDPAHSMDQSEQRFCWEYTLDSQQIAQVCDRWIKTGIVDDPSEKRRFFFRVRFDEAIDFALQHFWQKGAAVGDPVWLSPFPFPTKTVDEALRLLLLEWWDYRGGYFWFQKYYQGWVEAGKPSA